MSEVKVTQTKSAIGGTASQRATLKSLGLKRIGASSTREDTPETRGMIRAVSHLIRVEEVD